MSKGILKTFRRGVAAVLCAVMLVPALALPGSAAAETGLAALGASTENLIEAIDEATVTGKETTTNFIRFKPVTGAPVVGTPYLIRSVAYPKFVMSYSAVAETPGTVNAATSLRKTSDKPITVTDTDLFFEQKNTGDDITYIYLDHSNRDNVLWIFEQYNFADGREFAANDTNYFGGTRYRRVRLLKGTGADDAYWYAVNGKDATDPITQYRFMNPRYIAQWIRNTPIAVNDTYRDYYAIEEIESGAYLIYYRAGASDYRILSCDENGNWSTVRYTNATDDDYPPVSQITTDLNKLKVKLYSYQVQTNYIKKINFSGSTTFNVEQGTTYEQILDYIQQNIVVKDNARRNLAIPCSGDTAKVGYYYLAFNQKFDSSGTGYNKYTVTVNYRNDDGSDTIITTLTVYVEEPDITFAGPTTYEVEEGITEQEVRERISNSITVTDSARGEVAYSGNAPSAGCYWLEFDSEFDSSETEDRDYFVTVKYRKSNGEDLVVKTLKVLIQEKPIKSVELCHDEGIVVKNTDLTGKVHHVGDVEGDTSEPVKVKITYTDGTTAEHNISLGMLSKSDGNYIDSSVLEKDSGGNEIDTKYTGLKLTYKGVTVTDNFTLTVTTGDNLLNYPGAGEAGHVETSKSSTTSDGEFSRTGVANIELSTTGVPSGKGIDLIFIMDLSGSMLNAVDTNDDAPDYKDSRASKMKAALEQTIKMLAETGADVRIAMSDFGDIDHYTLDGAHIDSSILNKPVFDSNFNNGTYPNAFEFSNHLNFVFSAGDMKPAPYGVVQSKYNLSNPSYMGVCIPYVYTGTQEADAGAFVDVNTLYDTATGTISSSMQRIFDDIDINAQKAYGTNYDIGLEYAYHMGHSIIQQNIIESNDREVVCIFMSDGAPMQFNYFSGNPASSSWMDWIKGDIDPANLITSTTNVSAEVAAIEAKLLSLLKAGKLTRPDYGRGTGKIEGYDINKKESNLTGQGFYLYRTGLEKGDEEYFYTYMDRQNYDLDWEYLCDIAEVNGMTGFDYEMFQQDEKLSYLVSLLTDKSELVGYTGVKEDNGETTYYPVYKSKLKNPNHLNNGAVQYYEKYTGTETDFFKAMKSIGIDCTMDLFAKIAYKNRASLTTEDLNGDGAVNAADGQKYLTNIVTKLKTVPAGYTHATHSPYAHFYNAEGLSWWAEAIKGESTQLYPVINKYAYEDSTTEPYTYYGDVREDYEGKKYMSGFRGLDMDLYTISFSVADDNLLLAEHAQALLTRIASGPSYSYTANSEQELVDALESIVATLDVSATRGYYVDTMGSEFDLSTEKTVKAADGTVVTVNAAPTIRVLEYTLDGNGKRVGTIVRETVTFEDMDGDGDTDAWSDQVFTTQTDDKTGAISKVYTDIWNESTNLISGKYVYYNNNKYESESKTGAISISFGTQGGYTLPAESFFWVVGIIGETEMVLEYQVYLTGSVDGTRTGPVNNYDTNKEAILYYTNYLGNSCQLDTESPEFNWATDAIVIDYGIPVEIGVPHKYTATNNVVAVKPGSALPGVTDHPLADFDTTQKGKYGTMTVENGKMVYTLNSMAMDGTDVFVYAIQEGDEYYCSTITVIPATIIYYEDGFLSYKIYNAGNNQVKAEQWPTVGTAVKAKQAEDRPGEDIDNALGSLDADNLYGYDGAYTSMTTYSMGETHKVTVDNTTYATAEFSFCGTGFDVISLTSSDTGTILVSVYKVDSETGTRTLEKSLMVDTYYGYTYDEAKNQWSITPVDNNALYQVPVMKVEGLAYGQYFVEIMASYADILDHKPSAGTGEYDFYLDAIRIYDPANDGASSQIIRDAYLADGECWPEYRELRNLLISNKVFEGLDTNELTDGAVFIDGDATAAVSDYKDYGPNNEVYLKKDQSVGFALNIPENVASVQIAIKTTGGTGTAQLIVGTTTVTLNVSTTDQYFDLSAYDGKTISIKNTVANQVLSITNVKVTYKSDSTLQETYGLLYVDRDAINRAIVRPVEAVRLNTDLVEVEWNFC